MDRRLRIALAALAAVLVLWGGGWFVVAQIVERRAVDWIERERALGNRLGYRNLRVEGFPLRWRLIAEEYEIGRDVPMPQTLSGARLEATLQPWDLSDVPLRFPGKHRFDRRDANGQISIELEAARPEARMRLHPNGRIREIEVDLGEATARAPGADAAATATAKRVQVVAREVDPIDPKLREFFSLALALDDFVPPTNWQPPFNRPLRSGTAVIGVRGARIRNPNAAEQLEAWRNSGGVVELYKLELDWAPLFITGDGTGGLDAQNRPEAALAVRIAGYAELLDALVKTQQIGSRQAAVLGTVLGGLAKPDPATGRKEVRIPITAQNGRLTIAGFPMMNLPPVQLPSR